MRGWPIGPAMLWVLLLVTACTSSVVSGHGSGVPRSPAPSPGSSWLVYESGAHAVGQIGEMTSDDAGAHLLPINGPTCCYAASLSPDGSRLLFAGEGALLVAGRDGASPRALWSSPSGEIGAAAWSPSGRQIAFSVDTAAGAGPDRSTLYVVDADGRRRHRVATGVNVHALAWSPDGGRLALLQNQGGIWVVSARGGAIRSLFATGSSALPATLSWAPGRALLFDEVGQAPDGVWLVNPDGSGAHSVLPSAHTPSWGPGGDEFAAVRGGRVVLVDPIGVVQATIGPSDVEAVQWGDGTASGPAPSGSSSPAAPYTWHVQALDGTAANDQGTAAVVYLGNPHLFYRDATGRLLHTYWSGSDWVTETLDADARYGDLPCAPTSTCIGTQVRGPIAALVWQGQLHVFYSAYVRTATYIVKVAANCKTQPLDCVDYADVYGLKHMWFSGGAWHTQWLVQDKNLTGFEDSVGNSITAISYLGNPHVFWTGVTPDSTTLRHTWWTGSDWRNEVLDGVTDPLAQPGPNGRTSDAVGDGTSATVDDAACLHVFYEDRAAVSRISTRHGWFCPGAADWHFQTLDGDSGEASGAAAGDVAGGGTAALEWGGHVHVFEYGGHGLRHCYSTGHDWTCQDLDGTGFISADDSGQRAVSAVNYLGNPHVFYQRTGDLRHLWWTGSAWAGPQTLDRGPALHPVGDDSAPFVWADQLHVAYLSTDDGLKHAWYGP